MKVKKKNCHLKQRQTILNFFQTLVHLSSTDILLWLKFRCPPTASFGHRWGFPEVAGPWVCNAGITRTML